MRTREKPTSLRRVPTAFIFATILPAVILSCYIVASRPSPSFLLTVSYFVLLLNTNIIVSIVHVLIFGIPAYLIGVRLKVISWWSCLITGFFIGALPQIIVFIQNHESVDWSNVLPVALPGAIGGLVFWFSWNHRIKDKEYSTYPNNNL